MFHRRRTLTLLVLVALAAVFSRAGAGATPQDQFAEAERLFAEKSYRPAIEAFGAIFHDPSWPEITRAKALLRMAEANERIQQWDEAIRLLTDHESSVKIPIWHGRLLALRGSVALTMPTYYYEKDGVRTRGRWVQGGDYHHDEEANVVAALRDLEAAVVQLRPIVAGMGVVESDADRTTAEISSRAALQYAQALEAFRNSHGGFKNGIEPSDELVAAHEKFGVGRQLGTDPQAGYRIAEELAVATGLRANAALSRYLQAMYCGRLLEVVSGGVTVLPPDGDGPPMPKRGQVDPTDPDRTIWVALPESMNPFAIMKSLWRDYPGTDVEDDGYLAYANLAARYERYVEAERVASELLDRFPRSFWRSDAEALLQEIRFPMLQIEDPRPALPGEKVALSVSTRNVSKLRFQVWKFDLGGVLESRSYLRDDDANFAALAEIVKKSSQVGDRIGRPDQSFVRETPDRGEHRFREMEVPLDLPAAGAYLIEADGDGVSYRVMALVSDLAMIRKTDAGRTIVFVADARTGQPVAGARTLVRQKHRADGLFGNYTKVTWGEGETGADGLFERPHEDSRGNWFYIEACARRGDSYALSAMSNQSPREREQERGVVFAFTDRPVYRPLDTVSFVANLRLKREGGYNNLPGVKITARVRDAKGNAIYEQVLETDADGAISDRIVLGEEPPLGGYRIDFTREKQGVGQASFVVEEYKKPEFEVAVIGPEDQVKAGGKVKFTIAADYYSGGGVPGATVKYRVFRRSWHPFFSRPDRWAYLYGRRSPSSLWGGRELVVEAEGRSDEAGRLEVLVDTAAMTAAHPEEHHRLEIEADVTDLSRRTISGSGEVIAARTAIFAQVSSERGFHRAGEKAEFSIRAVRPSGEGVATRGRAVVYRLTDRRRPDGDVETTRTQQHVAELATDEAGEGRFSWTFDAPGRFAVAYETEDVWGGRVTGEAVTWVTAPGYRADEFLVRDIEVVTDRDTYQPGETAYILLNGTYEDAAVLLTIEADRTILKHEVIRLDGQTKVLALPITDAFGPNCFLHATMVQGGTFFESHVELRVPPTRRFLDVSLTSARDTYRPGEMVDLRLSSRDSQGRPVPARFALRVMDRAITYIAADGTPDVRTFFYGDRRGFNGGSSWGGNTRNSVAFRFGGHLIDQPTRRRWRRHGAPIGTWFDYSHADAAILDLRSNVVNLDRAAGEEPEEESEDFAGGFAEGKADAAPSAAAPMRSEATREMLRGRAKKSADKGVYGDSLRLDDHDLEADPGSAPVEVRRNFSDLAAWEPELHTDAAGVATVSFRLPDSLTTWVATARGLTTDTRVGQDEVQFKTTKNLLIRLQAPRFFTERDEVVLSGVIRNAYDEDLPVTASLDLEGGELELLDRPDQEVVVTAGGEKRVDWLVRVLRSGEARLKMTARSARESDAVAMSFPVLEYGRDRVVTQTEVLTGGDARQVFAIDVPADRRVGSTRLELTLAPSLGATLLEALPYLIEYPYGCTEQTMSRFMPAVVVARALKDSGTSLEEIAAKRRDLDEREAHAISDRRPIWTDAELEDVVSSGLRRLEGMQNPDGGFGWWRLDRSSVHLTSYVLHGLCEARRAGYEVPSAMIDRAVRFLRGEAGEISGLELATYAAFAMAEAGHKEPKLLDHVWDARDRLGSFAKAQLALAFHRVEDEARAKALLRSLEDFAEVDEKNGTCHWPARGSWWYWHGDEIETNAAVLLAVATIEPEHRLARPLASWLVRNRSGNRWKSTRDTAASVLALARFMKGAGELDPNYTVDVRFGDGPARTSRVDRATMFTFDNRLVLEGDAVETGRRDLVIEKKGPGVLYLDARLSYFSTEEKIAAAGHGVEVARSYFLLTPTTRTEKRGDEEITVRDFERTKLDDLAEVSAGAEVEVVMTLTVDNDYEYVMVEDRKPSGFEPVELRSGGRYANGLCSNMELRDEKVVFFVTWLQQGKHRIAYRMRAEVPGRIHAMPCRAVAMYAPRLGGISDSWMVRVEDPTR